MHNLVSRMAAAVLVAIAAGCASAPPTTAPQLTSMPPVVIEAFCAKLHAEGYGSDSPMYVVRTTQPIISGASLRSLGHLYGKDADAGGAASVMRAVIPAMPLEFGNSTACAWNPIEKLDPVQQAQLNVVEFSAPFPNPFTKGESGVLARLSIGGRDAQWYWVPLAERNGQLGVGLVLPMDLHDS